MSLSLTRSLVTLSLLVLASGCNAQPQKLTPMDKTSKDIFLAIENSDINEIKRFIDQKGSLEVKNKKGQTPLMAATYENAISIAKLFIDAGANVNTQDDMANSPFLYAGASGYTEIVKMCVKNGADYKIYNRFGGTALIPACEKGHVETVIELLKDKKFPIDHVNNLGWTALMEVMVIGKGGIEKQTSITKLLIDAGCNVNIPDKEGITALTHARRNGYKDIIKLLEKAGAH